MTDFEQIASQSGISGVLIDGHFWHYKDEVTESAIVLRKGKEKAQKIINLIVVAFAIGALFIFGLGMFLQFSDALLDPKTWTSASGTMFAFWIAILSFLFLFYRLVDANTQGKTIPQPSDGRPVELSTIPSLDVVERKEDIASILASDSQTTIDEAYRLAVKAGHAEVTASHLFLGGISTTSIQMLFVRLGISFDQLKDALRRHMATVPKGETVFGGEARTILAEAFSNAVMHERPELSVIEIFLEAYKKDEFLRELFYSLNVEEDQIENVVNWIRINEQLVDRYKAYRKSAANKPKGNMDRAYTAVQTKFLDQVSEDLTRAGVLGHLPLLVGRDAEMDSLLRAIEGGSQSVVLVGPAGVGKKTLIAGLAERMVEEDVPKILQDKRLVKLSVPHIVSAQGGSGAEERLLIALQEVGMSGNIILVIEGIEQLVGAGTGVDLSSILASELDKRYTFVIGTSTPQGYAALEKSVLVNKLEKVLVEEPERKDAIQVLEAKIGGIESKHKVVFTYAAVESLIDMSMRYLHDSYLPHKAIVLAQEVALQVSKTGEDWARVGKPAVAKIISEKSKIPITEVDQEEGQKLLNLEDEIHKRVIGQEDAVKAVSSALRRARVELRAEGRPIANFLFLGPTGVGKTELAKATAEVYFGNETSMLRFDMSEYQDKPSVIRLIGTSGEGGLLTEAVRKNPFALVLLDELEKAHPDILNLFLQVMDDGRLTDGTGRTIDFTNVILIATSNAATQYIMDSTAANVPMETMKQQLMEEELKTVYRPEFLNRFDGVMVFKPLSKEDVVAIAYLMIQKVVARLALKGISFRASDEAVHELAAKGYDPKFGARPLRRVIQEDVDNSVAEFLLQGKVNRRDTLVLNPGGEIVVEKAAQL